MGLLGLGEKKGKDVKKETETEVKDKFFGGKEIEKKTIKRKGDKKRVEETEVETWPGGKHKKTEHKVKGDKI